MGLSYNVVMNFISLSKIIKQKTPIAAAVILTCLASSPILSKKPEGPAVGPPVIRGGGVPQNINALNALNALNTLNTLNAAQPLIPVGNSAVAIIVPQTASYAAPKTIIMPSSPPSAAQGNGPAAPIQRGSQSSVPNLQISVSNSGPGSAPSLQISGSVGLQTTPNLSASTPQPSPSGAAGAVTQITSVNAGSSNSAQVGTGTGGGEVLTNFGSGSSGHSIQSDAVVRPQSPSHSSNNSVAAGGAQSNPSLNGENAANSVSNNGTAGSGRASNPVFTTSNGEVLLAAGKSVELVDPGTPELRVEVTAPKNQALNLGKIIADSGRKGIFAGIASRGDVPRAEHAVVTSGGRVLLRSRQNIAHTSGETGAAGGAVRDNAAGSSGKNAEPKHVASASPQGATNGRAANDGDSGGTPHTTGASQSEDPRDVDLQTDALLRSENSQGNSSHGGNSQEEGSRGQASQGSSAHGSDSNGGSPQGNGEPFQRPATGFDVDEAKSAAAEQKQSGGATVAESAERKGNVCS